MRCSGRVVAAILMGCAAGAAQDIDITGRVVDGLGAPVAGARLVVQPLHLTAPPTPGRKGVYLLALQRHQDSARWPSGATDHEGTFRMLLSPSQRALAAAGGREVELVVRANGYATWRRAIGSDPRAAGAEPIVLKPSATSPGLQIRCDGPRPARGWVTIERPFRVRGQRTIWLRDLLPLQADGSCEFHEPPLVPGEIPAIAPTMREEGYRVTVYAAGCERLQKLLTAGSHALELPAGPPARRVVVERAEPARAPLQVTWRIGGDELTLTLDEPAVPLLGGEMPLRIESASGPVAIDSWDPDLPLFVQKAPPAGEAPSRPPPPPRASDFALVVHDFQGQPAAGAGLWLEDAAVKQAGPDCVPFAVCDANGRATLRAVPHGTHWLWIRHPGLGERELPIGSGSQQVPLPPVRLRKLPQAEASESGLPGTLLLALDGGDLGLEAGILGHDGRVHQRRFPATPRFLRLEGLVPGPTTFYLARGEQPSIVFGGVLATDLSAPPLRPLATPVVHWRLNVLDSEGQPARDVSLWFPETAEGPRPARRPGASAFALQKLEEPGTWRCSLALHGSVWLRVHGAQGESRDVLFSHEKAGAVIAVKLQPGTAAATPRDGGK
jgi:hypothetical protein